jgi:general secretion pathway protein A
MQNKLLALYGLKFNPFTPSLPTAALHRWPAIEQFLWRVEHQTAEGGFALVTGDPGTGKSASLRILAEHLAGLRDLRIALVSRPQASLPDFYRELGCLFNAAISPHNRWAGANVLRRRWIEHFEASLYRPVLLVDEAQEMAPAVLSELRLLSSTELDSQAILTIILAGDSRLQAKLQTPELLPVASRIRSRLRTDYLPPEQLRQCLTHLLNTAGAPTLMTPPLVTTLCEHAAGNLRTLTAMANEMLTLAMHKEIAQLDEALYFETFALEPQGTKRRRA